MRHTIIEYTDNDRKAEYATSVAPHLVTKAGKISAYGMACGYVYQCVADITTNDGRQLFTSVCVQPCGDGYFVNYFSNFDGRTKAFRHFQFKRDAERHYEKLSREVRASGVATSLSGMTDKFGKVID